jgi:hypothetical protein
MKKRSSPHIPADEHFNPPPAEQRSYSAEGGLDGVLKLLQKISDQERRLS